MATIFDYLKWRGDISFKESKLNKIDALIFAHLSYSLFDDLIPEDFRKKTELSQFAVDFKNSPDYLERISDTFVEKKKVTDLTQKLAETRRFRDVKITGYINKRDEQAAEQFSAITFIANKVAVIAFRGTDDYITGWHEDFNIGWQEEIPAVKDAMDYLNQFAKKFHGKIILTGHSKGGHIAVSVAAKANSRIQRKIVAIYNFDGPGFSKEFLEGPLYTKIAERTFWIYPRCSLVGMIFHHPDKYEVCDTDAFGIKGHNALYWNLLGAGFDTVPELEDASIFFNNAFNDWCESLTKEQIKNFVSVLFDIIESSGVKTIGEITANFFTSITKMLSKYSSLDKESKTELKKILKIMSDAIVKNSKLEKIEKDEIEIKV